MHHSAKAIIAILSSALLAACAHHQQTTSATTDPVVDKEPPNFLLIVVDDVGFTDLGAFGGEIPTPNIDTLAEQGLIFSNFYAAPTCSPTRAMLMTGVDSHLAGLGNMEEFMADNQRGRPGYEGHINDDVVTVAEVLRDNGYRTYMTGKWHLGLEEAQSPWARGFDRSFASLMGGASHFNDMAGPTVEQTKAAYRRDQHIVETLPSDFYSSDFYTDEMITYIDTEQDSSKPFFAYLAYTATHFPVQAPDAYLEKYRGKYDDGYEQLRQDRFERFKSTGLIPSDAQLPDIAASVEDWNALSPEEQKIQSRTMEAYAAMVDNLDVNVGRMVDYLKTSGKYDNTYIIFLSDNGPEGNPLHGPMFASWINEHDNSLENIGRKGSFAAVGPGWAEASSAPFRAFKSYTNEGGIRVPAFIHIPSNAAASGVSNAVATVKDVAPTILAAAGIVHTGTGPDGEAVHAPSGRSLMNVINQLEDQVWNDDELVAVEIFGRRAMRMGQWKAVLQEPPNGTGVWELYDLSTDIAEQQNLATTHPDILKRMQDQFEEYEQQNGLVYPEGPAGY